MVVYQDKSRSETTTHFHLVQNQNREYRNMIRNCNETTIIVYVDLSEAWKCKFISEVQSCHYGQSFPQITLHTGMFYTKHEKAGFSTILESKHQDAAAIWTDMDQALKAIHFQSYNTILMQPFKSITGTRQTHQVLAQGNIIHRRHFIFSLTLLIPDEHQNSRAVAKQSPLVILMEAMEKELSRAPDGTTTTVGSSDVCRGDWLVVMYDQN
ncbi:hypothetical protein ACER0C_003206 [Sarotherodon galilaeus]